MATEPPADLICLEDINISLPDGVRFIPEKKPSDYGFVYPNPYQATAMFLALVSLLLAKHIAIGIALFVGCVPVIVFFIGIQDQRDKRRSKDGPRTTRKRRGILIGSDEIAISDGKEWRRINRLHPVEINARDDSGRVSIQVFVHDERRSRPIRISPRTYDLAEVLAELDDWMNAKSSDQRDPTAVERNGTWVELLNDVSAYRSVIPKTICKERPQHPFTTEDLRDFAGKLREFEPVMKRRDWFVTGRTIALGLVGIGGLSALGIQGASPWMWAYLIGPILFCAWMTWGKLKIYHQDKTTRVFGGHLFWISSIVLYGIMLVL